MNSKQVLDLIKHPEKLQKAEADELQRALEEYPYSGVLQALYLKALKNQNNYLYPKQLKRTAIAVPDRKVLYYWAEGDATPLPEEEKPRLVFEVTSKTVEEVKPDVPVPEAKQRQEAIVPEPEIVQQEKPVVPEKPEPVPTPAPKPVQKSVATSTSEINLDNLPASVRETVLRARRVREQLGKKYDEEKPKTATAPAKPIPAEPPIGQPVVVKQPEPEQPEPIEKVVEEKPIPKVEPILVEPHREEVEEPKVEELPEVELEPEIEEEIIPEPPKEVAITAAKNPEREKHSFLDWLGGNEEYPDQEEETVESEAQKLPEEPDMEPVTEHEEELAEKERPSTEQVQVLYEQFMEKKPRPRLDFKAQDAVDTASLGTSDYAHYITETLAQIYVKQKLYDRALNAYEILRLKYPEKSSFFAARISEIKQLLNENN